MNLSIGYKLNVTSKKHDLNPLFMHHCVKTKKAPLTPWMKGTFYNCPEPLTFKVKSPVLLPRRKMRLLHLTTAVCHDVVRKKMHWLSACHHLLFSLRTSIVAITLNGDAFGFSKTFWCLWEDKVVQNSAGARQGTTPTQLTLSSKRSASCVVSAELGK